MATVKLSTLKVGEKFKLITNRFFLRNHIYRVVKNENGEVVYEFDGYDKYQQKTITNGNQNVKKID